MLSVRGKDERRIIERMVIGQRFWLGSLVLIQYWIEFFRIWNQGILQAIRITGGRNVGVYFCWSLLILTPHCSILLGTFFQNLKNKVIKG